MTGKIQYRLYAIFLAVISLSLGLSGGYSYYQTSSRLEAEYLRTKHDLTERLRKSLILPAWELDTQTVAEIIAPEIRADIVAIEVKLTAAQARIHAGQHPKADAEHIYWYRFPLHYTTSKGAEAIGDVHFAMSYLARDIQLRDAVMQKVAEIALLDVLILFTLYISMQQLVFEPLRRFGKALDDNARITSGHVELLEDEVDNEFSALRRSVNVIAKRLEGDIQHRIASEEALRKALADLQQAQDILVENEKMAALGGLVAGVAHEINTPLGITLTSASVLQKSLDEIQASMTSGKLKKSDLEHVLSTFAESTRLITLNTERAAQLVQSFKQVAVDQTSEMRRAFLLDEYLHEVVESLRPKLKKLPINVHIECEESIHMDSYPGAIAQVITNLMVNASMHAFDDHASGNLTLCGVQEAERIKLSVSDDGCGIPSENLKKIFEPFFTTKRNAGGSGLGLHIVYNIVTKQLGGHIAVESSPGHGTRFTITMPATA
ncbi:HAMP domain-containing histidine kinase [Burkholderiaceae bacterium DAT-1]|nr:HAMP domain-containing histidine kinase [Burkholderiaceae bacterium DAT-1]